MPLTVVMYHYVRPIADSYYPGIKGLELDGFRKQISYIRRYYSPVSLSEVVHAFMHAVKLPNNAILLTFDDGYSDHYRHVYPILCDRRIPAVFFPVASAVRERRMLDVHKIQFILASQPDSDLLVAQLEVSIEQARGEFGLLTTDEYRRQYWRASRFDSSSISYFKRLLQRALPHKFRACLVGKLFRQWVTSDERSFAHELYLSMDQARLMVQAGMDMGGHGYDHLWMDVLSIPEQSREIDRSLEFLLQVGANRDTFSYSYPYGAYSDETVKLLAERGFRAAFTTRHGVAEARRDDPLSLPRLPTNDLPSDL